MSLAPLSRDSLVSEQSPWLAVNTHPHREAVAIENLKRQGFVTYCPQVLREGRQGRHRVAVRKSLFPSYVFVEMEERSRRWRPILSTFGVRTVVRVGEQPGTVPSTFIEALRGREVEGAIPGVREPWRCGQQVKVTSGALHGLVGTIIDMPERERIYVLMDMLNQHGRVQVDRRRLSLVTDRP